MFIERCYPFFLEFRPNGIEEQTYRPYGTKEGVDKRHYKHIVPTTSTPHARLACSGTEEGCSYLENP